MNEDGTMARVPQLMEFVKAHNLKIITIADIVTTVNKKTIIKQKRSFPQNTASLEWLLENAINVSTMWH